MGELIDNDIDRKNVEGSKKKKKNISVLEDKIEKVEEKLEKHDVLEKKKKKKDKKSKLNGDSSVIEDNLHKAVNGDVLTESSKKKNKLKVETEPIEETVSNLSETVDVESESGKKKKKKKKVKESNEAPVDEEVVEALDKSSKKENKRVSDSVEE